MGRKKLPQNAWLPKYVKLHKSRYVYTPYLGSGQFGKEVVLASGDATQYEVLRAYHKVTKVQPKRTLKWLSEEYMHSPQYLALSPRTQYQYKTVHNRLMERGNGDMPLSSFRPSTIRSYLDRRYEEGAPIMGNREVAYLSKIFSWGSERDLLPNRMTNPCINVGRNRESQGSGRSPTDEEYKALYEFAGKFVWYLQPAMEFAYLMRLRKAEVLALRHDDIAKDGIAANRTKGSRSTLTTWSIRLRRALAQCQVLSPQVDSDYLIHDKRGRPINYNTFTTHWQRMCDAAVKKGIARFRFHDLKIKGVTDTEGNKQQASGHKTESQAARYDRSKPKVKPTR